MKLIIAKTKSEFRSEDLDRLAPYNPIWYETKDTPFENIKELFLPDEILLGAKPGYIAGGWTSLPKEKLAQIPNLKALCLSTTAYDWIPLEYLKSKQVTVTNTPGKSTISVAEYAIFMLVALARKLPLYVKNNWSESETSDFMGSEISGMKVGIVGMGAIGLELARQLTQGYGCTVSFYNRTPKTTPNTQTDLPTLVSTSDAIFLTIASNPETKNLLTPDLITSTKKGAYFVSIIDSDVYAEKTVLDLVANNQLGGYAFEGESKISEYKGNVFASPEIAYFTTQTIANESKIMTDSILGILTGHPTNVVS